MDIKLTPPALVGQRVGPLAAKRRVWRLAGWGVGAATALLCIVLFVLPVIVVALSSRTLVRHDLADGL